MPRITVILSARSYVRFIFAALLTAAAIVACTAPSKTPATPSDSPSSSLQRFEYRRILMGVEARLVLYSPDEPTARAAASAAFTRINALDLILSDYNPDSESMRLCAAAASPSFTPVSSELAYCVRTALDLSRASNGAFDITVGPLTHLWRAARRSQSHPDPAALAAARLLVNDRTIDLRTSSDNQTLIRLNQPGTLLDFGGIAKGYAADEALATLRARGITRALAALAGDIALGDPPPGKLGWDIAIDWENHPDIPRRTLTLSNCGISTSGDSQQFIILGGVRYSHILDPRTGSPLADHRAVTLVAPSAILSDALATTLCILDKPAGLALAHSFGVTQVYASDD